MQLDMQTIRGIGSRLAPAVAAAAGVESFPPEAEGVVQESWQALRIPDEFRRKLWVEESRQTKSGGCCGGGSSPSLSSSPLLSKAAPGASSSFDPGGGSMSRWGSMNSLMSSSMGLALWRVCSMWSTATEAGWRALLLSTRDTARARLAKEGSCRTLKCEEV